MRLRLRQTLRQQTQKELEKKYNPINLDYIFDEDDPLAPWLEERERPVLDCGDNSWLGNTSDDDDNDEGSEDPERGSSAVPVRLRDDDDDDDDDDDANDDDDDDDDDDGGGGSRGPPPGFGGGDAGGYSGDYGYPSAGASTPIYSQYGGGLSRSGGASATTDIGGSGSGGSGRRRDKGKNIVHDRDGYDVHQIGGDMSSLYLHGHDYGHVHYSLPSQDSSIDSSRYSMDYGHRYGDYGQSNPYPHQDMASQLPTSLFEGSYGHYQPQQDQDQDYSHCKDPRLYMY